MSQNSEVRELNNTLVRILNASPVCAETKRIMLGFLSKTYELKANDELQVEQQESIIEEGELNGTELDQGT